MKEDVLEVLMYLFQNYIYSDSAVDDEVEEIEADYDAVQGELLQAGFQASEIQRAFDWLDGLAERLQAPLPVSAERSFRIYGEREMDKLDGECRGFLLFLEQAGILHAETRELVIDQVMALDSDDIDLIDLKWIILIVLFNQPGQEEACAWMEDLLFDDYPVEYLH